MTHRRGQPSTRARLGSRRVATFVATSLVAAASLVFAPGQVGPAAAAGPNGAAVDLGSLGSPAHVFDSHAYGTNDRGDVVGYALDQSDAPHAFLREASGLMHDLGTLGGRVSSAEAVNESRWVVGSSHTSFADSPRRHAFLWRPWGMRDLGTLGGDQSWAYGVSNTGVIVGEADTSNDEVHATLWHATGKPTDLGSLGGTSSGASAVNDVGQVVGGAQVSSGELHAFLWDEVHGMVDLGTLGGSSSSANGINERGQVVGWSTTSTGVAHPFLWDPVGGMVDLTPTGPAASAVGIDDDGRVAGTMDEPTGMHRPFVWSQTDGISDLGTLGGATGEAAAINNRGDVVGSSDQAAPWNEIPHATRWPAEVVITLPAEGAHFPQGQSFYAAYSCASAVVSCIGQVPVGAPIDTRTAGPHTFAVTAHDQDGTQYTLVHHYVVDPDLTPPSISFDAPIDGSAVDVGALLEARYSCSDRGSGLASCVGTIPDGSSIDTSTSGTRAFTVTATDNAGNVASITRHYAVVGRTVSVGDASVVEGDAGNPRQVRFPVTLSRPSDVEVAVSWAVLADGTASDSDLVVAAGTTTFRPSERTGLTGVGKYVTARVRPDVLVEGDESFHVVLADPTGGYDLANATGVGTLVDDDPGVGIHVDIGDASVVEGDGTADYVVKLALTLSAPAPDAVTVLVTDLGGSATAGVDYKPIKPKLVTFAPGQWQKTVAVKVLADTDPEAAEFVRVGLSDPTGGVAIGRSLGVGTIIDGD